MKNISYFRNISIANLLNLPNSKKKIYICCPFHSEKTPSFVIFPNNKGFHCFGCGKHGQNAIDFVMALGFSFSQAIKELEDYSQFSKYI